jgi:hypothetical protein
MRPGPEWTKVKDESKDPSKPTSIPLDWKTLKDLVKIRRTAQDWLDWAKAEEKPVIGGWRTWVEKDESGIEVMRSDKVPEGGLPLYNFLRQDLAINWRIEIWGRYRFPDKPLLGPGDREYQELIKKKIEVWDFSLEVYKVEGDLSLENIKNKVSPQPFKDLGRGFGSLADYEREGYYGSFRGETGHIGEVQLKMKLFFREVDEQADTWQETPVEATLRYISAKDELDIDRIYQKIQRAP